MTQDVQDAVRILCKAYADVAHDPANDAEVTNQIRNILNDAIRHLAYPDRDHYPKTRRGTKGAPIVCK